MGRLTPLIGTLLLVWCCTPVNRNIGENREISTLLPCVTPPFLLGDPVSSAELASDIAEYVLAKKGFDCRRRKARVSFCDGVYTVKFLSGGGRPDVTYVVDIDADTSRVLSLSVLRLVS